MCIFFSSIYSSRVKKEFEGAAAIPSNSNVVAMAASSAAATSEAATSSTAAVPGSQYVPGLGTIQDAEGGQLQPSKPETLASTASSSFEAETVPGASAPIAAAIAAAGGKSEADSVHIPAAKLQDVLHMAVKMERKYSQAASMSMVGENDGGDVGDLDEDYTPHFQRVYISGDDNTGVSNRVFFHRGHVQCSVKPE